LVSGGAAVAGTVGQTFGQRCLSAPLALERQADRSLLFARDDGGALAIGRRRCGHGRWGRRLHDGGRAAASGHDGHTDDHEHERAERCAANSDTRGDASCAAGRGARFIDVRGDGGGGGRRDTPRAGVDRELVDAPIGVYGQLPRAVGVGAVESHGPAELLGRASGALEDNLASCVDIGCGDVL
jgi:hypothetical protein